jgi:hypothetical protein
MERRRPRLSGFSRLISRTRVSERRSGQYRCGYGTGATVGNGRYFVRGGLQMSWNAPSENGLPRSRELLARRAEVRRVEEG